MTKCSQMIAIIAAFGALGLASDTHDAAERFQAIRPVSAGIWVRTLLDCNWSPERRDAVRMRLHTFEGQSPEERFETLSDVCSGALPEEEFAAFVNRVSDVLTPNERIGVADCAAIRAMQGIISRTSLETLTCPLMRQLPIEERTFLAVRILQTQTDSEMALPASVFMPELPDSFWQEIELISIESAERDAIDSAIILYANQIPVQSVRRIPMFHDVSKRVLNRVTLENWADQTAAQRRRLMYSLGQLITLAVKLDQSGNDSLKKSITPSSDFCSPAKGLLAALEGKPIDKRSLSDFPAIGARLDRSRGISSWIQDPTRGRFPQEYTSRVPISGTTDWDWELITALIRNEVSAISLEGDALESVLSQVRRGDHSPEEKDLKLTAVLLLAGPARVSTAKRTLQLETDALTYRQGNHELGTGCAAAFLVNILPDSVIAELHEENDLVTAIWKSLADEHELEVEAAAIRLLMLNKRVKRSLETPKALRSDHSPFLFTSRSLHTVPTNSKSE